jgi:hypothetical protein
MKSKIFKEKKIEDVGDNFVLLYIYMYFVNILNQFKLINILLCFQECFYVCAFLI